MRDLHPQQSWSVSPALGAGAAGPSGRPDDCAVRDTPRTLAFYEGARQLHRGRNPLLWPGFCFLWHILGNRRCVSFLDERKQQQQTGDVAEGRDPGIGGNSERFVEPGPEKGTDGSPGTHRQYAQ